MKAWLRRYLGHDNLEAHFVNVYESLRETRKRIDDISSDLATCNAALGRIIAKLDPLFGLPEDDPARKKASDELGEQVIEKLKAEQAVLDKYGHKP